MPSDAENSDMESAGTSSGNAKDVSPQHIAGISLSLRVPPFWRDKPRLWFISFEAATLDLKKSESQRAQMVIAQLQKEDIEQICDLLYNPSADRQYSLIKERLISVYEESDGKQLQKLLSDMELGDQKPSQLLRRMRNLAHNKVPDNTLRLMWMNLLPAHVRSVLVVSDTISKDTALEELAKLADKMLEQACEVSAVSVATTSTSQQAQNPPVSLQNLVEEIRKLHVEIAELKTSYHHDRSRTPSPRHCRRNSHRGRARTTNRIERTASKRWRGSVRRVASAAVYNLSCFTHGCSTGWVSGVLGTEALTGGAWLAALPCLVALPAAPFFAVLADARGRKAGAFCICVSFIISWSLAAWCGPRGVWAARVAAGAGGAGALALAPLYCAEIAPRTRGLAAMPALACSCGILFAYAAGGVLSAHALSLSMAVPPAMLLVSLIWLPETPSFLISVGRIQDAAKIMCWFDGSDFREDLTDVIEQQEVKIRTSDCYGRREPVRRQDSDTFQPMLKRSSGLDSNSEKKREQSACRELFRHRRSRRALFSCLVVLSAAAGSGAGAVNSFAAAVLRHSTHGVPHLNLTAYNYTMYNGTAPRPLFEPSEAGSILCGTALVLGAAVAMVSVDKLGRKMLLLWSCSGITCCLAILGAYCDPNLRLHSLYSHRLWPYKRTHNLKEKALQLTENFTGINTNPEWKNYTKDITRYRENLGNDSVPGEWKVDNLTNGEGVDTAEENLWAPVALMSVVLFLYNIGLGSVPYVLISELFTINVRSLASSLLISWMWLSSFFILRYYGTIAISVGLHSTYYICASITFLGSLYIFFIIPETKGKAQEQIDKDLDGPLLVLSRKRKGRDQR